LSIELGFLSPLLFSFTSDIFSGHWHWQRLRKHVRSVQWFIAKGPRCHCQL
jgi:hypothetical protein